MKERQIDVLRVSETCLLPIIPNQFNDLPQYSVFRNDESRGGGVCIFVRDYLSATLLPTHTINRPPGIEDVRVDSLTAPETALSYNRLSVSPPQSLL